jgi:hypothetical protein
MGEEPSRILGIGLQTKTLNDLFTDEKVSSRSHCLHSIAKFFPVCDSVQTGERQRSLHVDRRLCIRCTEDHVLLLGCAAHPWITL